MFLLDDAEEPLVFRVQGLGFRVSNPQECFLFVRLYLHYGMPQPLLDS